MSNIDLDGALRSPGLAFEYYVNSYHCGNSLGITDFEMGQILDQWSDQVPIWKNYVENVADEVVYELDKDDYNKAMELGKEYGQEKTGYEDTKSQKNTQVAETTVNTGTELLSLGTGIWRFVNLCKGGTGGTLKEFLKSGGKGMGSAMTIITCCLDLVMAVLYMFLHPNRQQHDAAMKVKEELTNQQEALDDIEDDMANDDEAMRDLVNEKNEIVENANQSMGEDMALYDFNRHIYEYYTQLMRERDLTKSEQALYNSAFQYMQQAGNSIGQTRGETQETVDGIQNNIGEYEDRFDDAMSGMGEVEGFTTYAAGFDELTHDLCKTEAITLFAAVASCTLDGIVATSKGLTPATCWMLVFAGMAFLAAGMNYAHATEQLAYADDIEGEIGDRKETEGMNTKTHKSFDNYYDYFGGYMGNRVDMVVPDVEQRLPEER